MSAFPYHQQDDAFKCGPAVIMMYMDATGQDLLQQDDIMSSINSVNDPAFNTSPEAMLFGLKLHVGPDEMGAQFVPHTDDNIDAAMDHLVAAFTSDPTTLPVAAWDGGAHWLVVTALAPSPTGIVDTNDIRTVYVHSPAVVRFRPPPPHEPNDVCGTSCTTGSPNVAIALPCWKKHFYPVVTADKNFGYVTITRGASSAEPETMIEPRRSSGRSEPLSQTLDQLIDFYLLRTDGPLTEVFAQTTGFGDHVCVRNLDDGTTFHLHPLLRGNETIGYIATEGVDLCWASGDPCNLFSEEQLIRLFSAEFRGDGFQLDTDLVWRICQEAVLPNRPFYRAVSAGQERFLRIDGAMFSRLTPLKKPHRNENA